MYEMGVNFEHTIGCPFLSFLFKKCYYIDNRLHVSFGLKIGTSINMSKTAQIG